MKQRSFFLILLVVIVSLLSLAGGVLAWTLQSSPLTLALGGLPREPLASLFVPKQSPLMISLLVNPDSLEKLTQWKVSPFKRFQTQRDIRQLETNLLSSTGLDYRKEIKPWLGEEITLAVTSLDYDRNRDNGIQPGYLLAVQTKKSELAKEFLQAAYSKNALSGNSEISFEQYKGVEVITQRLLTSQPNTVLTSSAVIADFVLFANQPKILREAINTLQVANLSLESSPAYSRAIATITEPRLGLVYGNLPLVSAWLGNVPSPENADILQTVTVSLSLKAGGIVAQTALIGGNQLDSETPILSEPIGALDYIPSDSIISIAGVNLPQLWTKVQTELAENSPLQQLVKDAVSRLERNLGLNLTEDIFPWVKGEFSLALTNDPNSGTPQWLFVVESQPGVTEGINHLDEIAAEQGLSVGSLPLLGSKAIIWSQLETETSKNFSTLKTLVKGAHTSVPNYEIIATSVETLSSTIKNSGSNKRDLSDLKQAVLPKNNDGYVYLNWPELAPLLEQKYPLIRVAQLSIQPLLDHLNSVILTSLGSKNGVRQATIYFSLSPMK